MRILILLLTTTGAAWAECPTAKDLAGSGILITDEEGTVTLHQRQAGDLIRTTVDYGDGEGLVETVKHGFFDLTNVELEDGTPVAGSEMRFTYEGGAAALPAPVPGGGLEVASKMVFDGGETEWQIAYSYGPPSETKIDDCSFKTFLVEAAMQGPLAPPQFETFLYFTDLGIAHLASSKVGSMNIPTAAVSIAVAPGK